MKKGRKVFAEFELMMSLKDDKGVLLEYVKNNPGHVLSFIEKEKIEVEIKLLKIQKAVLCLARAVSYLNEKR